jgi:hypothetical protein
MAQSITNAFVTLFDAEVKQAYQGESTLLGANSIECYLFTSNSNNARLQCC